MSIDTLADVKKLESAGVPRPQAEAHAEAFQDDIASQLATKGDLDDAVRLLKSDIDGAARSAKTDLDDAVRSLKGDNSQLKAEIIASEMRANGKFDRLEQKMDGRFTLLQWMIGFMLAVQMATFWRLLK